MNSPKSLEIEILKNMKYIKKLEKIINKTLPIYLRPYEEPKLDTNICSSEANIIYDFDDDNIVIEDKPQTHIKMMNIVAAAIIL